MSPRGSLTWRRGARGGGAQPFLSSCAFHCRHRVAGPFDQLKFHRRYMKFPLQPVSEPEEAEPFLPDASAPSDGARDFVAEDDYLVGFNLEDGLAAIGYRCCGLAGPAEEALSAAEYECPAIADVNFFSDRTMLKPGSALKPRSCEADSPSSAWRMSSPPRTRRRSERHLRSDRLETSALRPRPFWPRSIKTTR